MRRVRAAALVALLILHAPPVCAQAAAASLTGRVTAEGGAPLSGITVTVASPVLISDRATITGVGGHYFIRELPPGVYDVYFEGKGVQTLIRRAELQVAEISRLDAELARSEVEETVTSTSLMPTLLEAPQLATNLDIRTVDRLPLGRSVRERRVLAPGLPSGDSLSLVDGVVLDETVEEAIEETTILTGALPPEYAFARGGVIASVTRRGGNDFSASLRATFSDGSREFFEAAGGGRIVADRLWFFVAGSDGDTIFSDEARRFVGRLSGAVADGHMLDVSYYALAGEPSRDTWSARYDGQLWPTMTANVRLARNQWSAAAHFFRSTASSGSHSIIAGGEDLGDEWQRAFFVNDFWRLSPRWSMSLGARHTTGADDELGPRAGAVFDVREDGEHRISGTWGRYATRTGTTVDETTVAYGWRFSVLGYARADLIRRSADAAVDLLQIHGSYDLFRLIRLGGNYTARLRGSSDLRYRSNVWVWYEPPVGDRQLTLALLYRYLADETESFISTDFSSTLAFPAANVTAFVKVDLLNAFDDPDPSIDPEGLSLPRTWRAAAGVRF